NVENDYEYEYETTKAVANCRRCIHAHLRSRLPTLERPIIRPGLALAGDRAPRRADANEEPRRPPPAAGRLGAGFRVGHVSGAVGIDRAEERERDGLVWRALVRPARVGGQPGRISPGRLDAGLL